MQSPPVKQILPTFLLLSAVLAAGCGDAPVGLKYDARSAVEQARAEGAERHAADLLHRAEQAYRSAVSSMERESARWTPARDYASAESQFRLALGRARLAGDLSIARRRRLEARTDALLATVRDSFDNVNFVLSYLSPRTRVRADVMRARILYEEARQLRARGDLDLALDRARETCHEIALVSETLARIIDRHTTSDRAGLYRRWVQETVQASASAGGHAILVDKFRHTLTLLKAGRVVRTYRADIGLNGAQDKSFSGDKATPEGMYRIVEKRGPGKTRWYKALLLNYPNEQDRAQFAEQKRHGQIPKRARIGGLIEIHGEGGRFQDWTEGCVALSNRDIDDLFDLVSIGTPVTIVGYESDDWLSIPQPRTRPVVAERPRTGSARRGRAPKAALR